MKVSAAPSRDLISAGRIDAAYFLEGADAIRTSLAEASGYTLRSLASLGDAYAPSRFKRTYAVPGEDSVSYLRPYDVFEYLPPEADRLSVTRTEDLDNYLIRAGDILQTCSGRNLGPVTIADSYLAQFALSHDMVRVRIANEEERLYVLAFLRSRTGQHLLRGDRGGSVISHITTEHVDAIQVPFIDSIMTEVVDQVRRAVALRESSRVALQAAVEGVNRAYPNPPGSHTRGWTVPVTKLADRFDAAFHSRQVSDAKAVLARSGEVTLDDAATVVKPSGRHKMVYVGRDHGFPFLSGRQILQCDLVAAKYLSRHSVQSAGGFALKAGTVIFQADGRAEESLGYPAFVTDDREGWLASGHVGRAIPKNDDDAGWLWAAMASDIVQAQIAALSRGSVVDALYPEDLAGVLLPPRGVVDSTAVRAAWVNMAEGSRLLTAASGLVDGVLGSPTDRSVDVS